MKIGLALSGGGALVAAHIGAISQLESNNIHIDSICGCSAGAIVGLLYAWGGIESINKFFDKINEHNLFSPTNIVLTRSPEKLFVKIENALRDIIHTDDFNKLNIKYSCVATDFITGNTEIFVSGDPIKCVLASSAYPGVFPIQLINNKYYVDGGVSLNMPVSPLKKQGMDFVIASSTYSLSKYDPTKTKTKRLLTAIRAMEIMEHKINEYELSQADFIFKPPVNEYYWYNFSDMKLIRDIGESYAFDRINSFPFLEMNL